MGSILFGATSPHPGAYMFSLQYNWRPDECFLVQVWMWNLGSLSGSDGDVGEEVRKRMTDVCSLQEVRWRGQGVRMLGVKGRRYKLWWSGIVDGVGGVGVMVKEELCEKVVDIRRVGEGVITVLLF